MEPVIPEILEGKVAFEDHRVIVKPGVVLTGDEKEFFEHFKDQIAFSIEHMFDKK